MRKLFRALIATTAITALAGMAHAQGPSTGAAQPTGENDGGIADIIVTAERRSTDVQTVPLAITAIGGDALQRTGVVNTQSLQQTVPGLVVTSAGSATSVLLRGVGGNFTNSYGDPAVAFNIDGVYVSRLFAPSSAYFDLDRVEVLKGPQGTLYGRNATVGAINLISRRPRFDRMSGEFGVQVGNYQDIQAYGAANLPLSGDFAIRIAGRTVNRDGHLKNGYNDAQSRAARISALWEPNDAFSLLVIGTYTHDGGRGHSDVPIYFANNTQRYIDDEPFRGLFPDEARQPFDGSPVYGSDGFQDIDTYTIQAELNVDLGPARLTVIPAYRRTTADFLVYFGGFNNLADQTSKQFSLEARLASDTEGPLTWLIGGYYFNEKQRAFNQYIQQTGYFTFILPRQPVESYAAFGQATYAITPEFRLTGGLRYSHERKEQSGTTVNPTPGICSGTPIGVNRCQYPNTGKLKFSHVDYKVGIEFDAGPRSLIFANVSSGYKAGGFFVGTEPNTYPAEKLTSYQIGTKNRFFDNKLQVNVEGFYWDYQDQQVSLLSNVNPSGFSVRPVPADGYLYGVEGNFIFQATRNDRLSLDVLWEKGRYKRLDQPPVDILLPPFVPGGPIIRIPVVPARAFRDYGRERMPEWSLTGTYIRTFDIGQSGHIDVQVGTQYVSAQELTLQRYAGSRQKSYFLSNASVTFRTSDDAVSVTAYIDNIENEDIATSMLPPVSYRPPNPGALFADLRPPRTYGVRANFRF